MGQSTQPRDVFPTDSSPVASASRSTLGPSPPKKRKVSAAPRKLGTPTNTGPARPPPPKTERVILKRGFARVLEAWQDIRERHESAPLSGVPQAGPGRTHAMRLDEDDIIDMRPAEPEYYLCRHALEKRGIKYTIGKSRALVDPVQAAILAAAGDPRKYAGGQADGQEPDGDSEDLDESESDDDGDNDESSIDEMGEWRNQDPVASTYRIQQKRREIDQQELDEFMAAERLRRAQDPPGCGPDDDLEPESEPEREPEPAPKPVVEPRTVDIDVSDDELSLQPVAMTPRGRSPKKECATPFATPTGRREQTAGPSTTKAIRKSLETISLEESDDELEVACSSPLSKGKPRAATAPARKGSSTARKASSATRRPSSPSGMRFNLQSPTPAPESALSAIACTPSSPAPLSSTAPPSPPPSAQRTPSPRKRSTSFAVVVPLRTRARPAEVVVDPELEAEPWSELEDSDVIVADSEDDEPAPRSLDKGKGRAMGLQTPPDSRGYAPRAPLPPSPLFAQPTASYVPPSSPEIPEPSPPRLPISPPPSKSLSFLARSDSPFMLTSPPISNSRTSPPSSKTAAASSPAAKATTSSPSRHPKPTLATSSPRKLLSDAPSPSSQRKFEAARIRREENEREAARLEDLAPQEWEHLERPSPDLGERAQSAQSAQSEDDDPLWFSPTKNEDAGSPSMASSPTRKRRRSSKRVILVQSDGSDDELMLA